MKEIIYFLVDFTEYIIMGCLLAGFLKDTLPKRFRKKTDKAAWLLCLQFMAVRLIVSYSPRIKQLIYGKEMYIADSRQSIIPVAVSIAFTLLAGMILYEKNRMKILSLVTAFYALLELVRFTLYPLAMGIITRIIDYYNEQFLDEDLNISEKYWQMVDRTEIVWNITFSAAIIFVLFLCIRKYKHYFAYGGNGGREAYAYNTEPDGEKKVYGWALLFVPSLLGLAFAAMLRIILFYYDKEIYNLLDRYAELNLLIPFLSLLCIASILLSVKLLGEMEKEHEKRRQAEVYQSQMEELEAHVRDMESVNIQIRGMKHDMKHYIADINALLAQTCSGNAAAAEEVRRYVACLQASLAELDLQYQTKNPVTDVILGRYVRLARQRGISFSSDFIYPKNLGIDAFDISIVLNNGLDNAFEACEGESGDAFVSLHTRQKDNMFLITIENTFTGVLAWEDGILVSSKSGPGHGLGLKNIRGCAEKYYGRMETAAEEGCFSLTVMLQGKMNLMTENK